MKIEFLEEVGSTNEYIKRYLLSGEDRIVIAKRQTGGKGTKGRSFLSESGGVYLSALNFYKNFPAENAFLIMAHAAVAVSETAESFGLDPEIKWPNDVLLAGKKLSGIRVVNTIDGGEVKSSIVGIGLNVLNELGELKEIAVSLSEAAGRIVPLDEARGRLIENLQRRISFDDYLGRVRFLGKEVRVIESGGETYFGKAVGVNPDGRLEVERGGKSVLLSAAEISLRF